MRFWKHPPPLINTLIPLLIALPVMWALLPSGLPNTADGPVHFIRAAEMVHAWQEGLLLPRWSANLGYGLGIPLFNYAPPLPYLITALLNTIGFPLEQAMKGMLLSGVLLSVYGAYRLTGDSLGSLPGAVGAAAYLYAPSRLRELFIQGNAGQFMAWAFLPWACWGVIRLYQTGHKRYALTIALALMGTTLSHNVVALLLALLLAGLTLVLFLATRNFQRTLWVGIGGLVGLGLGAWFWLPALLEGDYIQLSRIVASDFRDRFIPFQELIALSPPLDTGAINPYVPLTLGAIQVGLALIGGLGLPLLPLQPRSAATENRLIGTAGRATSLFFLCFTGFSGLMALEWSEPIWNRLPFVALFEFPARWHGVTAVGLAWLGALAVHNVGRLHRWVESVIGGVALILLMGSAIVNLYPQHLPPNYFRSTPADVVRWEVETGAVGTTSLSEFNPVWISAGLDPGPVATAYLTDQPIPRIDPATLPAGAAITAERSRIQSHALTLSLPVAATVTANLHYFPGWQATLNDETIPLAPHPDDGRIDLPLPAGAHQLRLVLSETPLRQVANMISQLVWLGLLGMVGYQRFNRRRSRPIVSGEASTSGVTLAIVGLAVGLTLGARAGLPGRFRVTSPPGQALLATTQQRIDFGDQVRLLGLDLPPALIRQGESLPVVAYWQAKQRLATDYAFFLHLDAPNGQTIAAVDQRHPSEIPTSHWPPTLYLRNPLTLMVPPDATPIRYNLRLGIYDPSTGAALPTVEGGTVGQVWVEASRESAPSETTVTRFGESIRLSTVRLDQETQTIRLIWQTETLISQDYSIFVHLLDAQGTLIGQVDGTPYQNQYPTSAWRVGQVIEDVRSLAGVVADPALIKQLAIGVYDPVSGARLAGVDRAGQPLPNDALIIELAE